MSPCGFVPRRSVDGGVVAPSRRVDAATDLHGDTRRAGRESAGTALRDWAIALLSPALAPCSALFPDSVPHTHLNGSAPQVLTACIGRSDNLRVGKEWDSKGR